MVVAASVGDVTVTHKLLQGKDDCVLGDGGRICADTPTGLPFLLSRRAVG